MRQQLEIVIVTSVDCDTWIPNQEDNESAMWIEIEKIVRRYTGDASPAVEMEYGEPV